MATSIISFLSPATSRPVLSAFSPARSVSLPTSTLRHRGLHLVSTASPSAFSHAKSSRDDSQAQADRIVAQVEQEIARRAFREHQTKVNGRSPIASRSAAVYTLPIAEAETPASVARRLFAALLSFARPA